MKRWKIGALVCALVVCFSMVLVGCSSNSYAPQAKTQSISSSALGKSGTLRVGVNASSAPLAGQTSSSSRIVGINVDIAAYLADQLGTKVEIIDVGNDPVSALTNGTVDMVLGVDSSETGTDYWRSDSYLNTGVALFAKNANATVPTADSKPKVGAQSSSRSSWRVTNLFGDDALVGQNDLKAAFAALSNGTIQYVAADAIIGTYVAHVNGYEAAIIALLQTPSGYCAAVAEKNKELQTAISNAMATLINGGVMDIIEEKWLGSIISLKDTPVIKAAPVETSEKTEGEKAEDGQDGGKTDASEKNESNPSATSTGNNAAADSSL